MIRRLAPLFLMLPAAAQAAPVSITVRGADGRPVAGAVVRLDVAGQRAPAVRGPYMVEQRDIQFRPPILIVPVGATVGFPNRDRVRHHVYSFSKARRFDLRLYGREDTRSVTFDRAGPVTLGCNIHDAMNAVVYVTASPFTALTDAQGRVAFDGVPAARASVVVWHPSIRAPDNSVAQPASVAATGLNTLVTLRR